MIQILQMNPNDIPLYFFATMNNTSDNWQFDLYYDDSHYLISDSDNKIITLTAKKPNHKIVNVNCNYTNSRIVVNLRNHPELVNFYGILRGTITIKNKSDGSIIDQASFTVQVKI